MCCTLLAGNTGRKNDAKSRHLGTIAQPCRAVSLQLRHVSTIGKKLLKQQYLLHMSPQYGELRPTNGWDGFISLGHPSKFQWVSHLAFVTAATSLSRGQPNCTMFGRLLGWYTMYTFSKALARWRNFAWRPTFAFSYIGSVTAQHSTSEHGGMSSVYQYIRISVHALQHGTTDGITELSQRALSIFGWVANVLGICPLSS